MVKLGSSLSGLISSRCALCHDQVADFQSICNACQRDLPCLENSCQACGIPQVTGTLCGSCMTTPGIIDKTICAYRYAYPLDLLIKQYKYQHRLDSILTLVSDLSEKILANQPSLPEVIVPVPLHFNRLCQRGFNQALEISKILSRFINVPVDYRLISRIRHTTPQFELTSKQRKRNLAGAFKIMPGRSYQSLAIVDDIITTGATGMEIARLFHRAGVRQIQMWALARADK